MKGKFYLTQVFSVLGLFISQGLFAQLSVDPQFPTQNDSVVITYNAAQGSGGLVGVSTVYAHTGVITTASANPNDWRYVQGNWGTADSKVQMTNLGNNLHRISFRIRDFYNVPANEDVLRLAFVFRNQSGSLEGKNADGSDMFIDLVDTGFIARFTSPDQTKTLYNQGNLLFVGLETNDSADIRFYVNSNLIDSVQNDIKLSTTYTMQNTGTYWLKYEAVSKGRVKSDSFSVYAQGASVKENPPAGLKLGINRISSTEAIFKFLAPFKDNAYILGDFNNWTIDANSALKQSLNDSIFWIRLTGLDPTTAYRYQVFYDDPQDAMADPYSELVLDPWNDQYISSSVYPNIPAYPSDKAQGIVSVFQMQKPVFNWQYDTYSRPDQAKLNVYELLIRDFTTEHTYASVLDTLNYLKRLGINAIELMPVLEFEGNVSWGYNVSFFLAPDKYYGPAEKLKEFVDACHKEGIAVILDIAMNHSFGQNPMVQMYFDPNAGQYGEPTAESPWFNQVAKHDFNVGYDFNHESPATKEFVKQVYQHWVEEYHIDGYRVDLSKGHTQKNTLGNVSAWGAYDASRVKILSEIRDYVHEVDPESIIILEHFADNTEEKILSDSGFILWGNMNHDYNEATMGYTSNLSNTSYKQKGWNSPSLIAFMESHDEERLMFKNKQYGAVNGGYSVKNLNTGLQRNAAAALLFFSVPGPKMIWQFGELGFDYSINRCEDGTVKDDCRLSPKPIVWSYYQVAERKALYDVYAALMLLRNTQSIFHSDNFTHSLAGTVKYVELKENNEQLVAVANFGTSAQAFTYKLSKGGTWKEYFSGNESTLSDSMLTINLDPGEYRLYSSSDLGSLSSVSSGNRVNLELTIYPNPGKTFFRIDGLSEGHEAKIEVFDLQGKSLIKWNTIPNPTQQYSVSHLKSGVYLIAIEQEGKRALQRLVIQ